MGADANIAVVKRFYDEVVNQRKIDVMDEIFAPNFAGFKEEGVPVGATVEDFKQTNRAIQAAFADVCQVVDEYIACGDKVVARCTVIGTHTGNTYAGVPATGKRIKIALIDIWRVENGKLTEQWFQGDIYSLFVQLGTLPPWDKLARAKWTVEGE